MLKYYNTMVVFEEIPDEVTLAINITNCPCRCAGCHSKFLWEDVGTPLDEEALDTLVSENGGVTCVCFMGGDSEPSSVDRLAEHVKKLGLKSGWYSGFDEISESVELKNFDYVKIGRYMEDKGGLNKPTTNQRMYMVRQDGSLMDITEKFWK